MAKTSSAAALLHAAIQDLHAGLCDQAERMPGDASDAELTRLFDDERRASSDRAAQLVAAGLNPSGPENLWMRSAR